MTNTETSKSPTHRVYAVRKVGTDKTFWNVIGAAWAHADGKGFNIKLFLLPTDGSEIVVREPKDEEVPNAPSH